MKIFKKSLAILLCLIMAVGIMPLSASADTEPADYVKTDFRFEAGQPVPTKRSQYTVKTGYIASEGVEIILSAYTTGLDYMRDGVYLDNGGKFTEQNSGTFLKNTGYQLKVCFTCPMYTERDLVLIAGDETYSYYDFEFRLNRVMIDGHKTEVWNVCYYYYIPIADMAQTVTTYAQLQSALSQYGTNAIKLGNDITKEIGLGKTEESEAAQLTVNGTKILNLNGKKLKVVDHSDVSSDKDYTLDSIRTLFTVSSGADFTVEDTRGTGEVKYDAHYISPTAARFDYARYSDIAQRNMFDVHGKLTVYSGTFIAGGAKKQYLSDQLKHAYQIAAGYIVNTNEDGEATFNGGKFIGHTYFGDFIVFRGFSKITINGGEFENNGAGYFVSKYMIKDNLIINNGSFVAKTFTIRTTEHSDINSRYEEGTIKEFRIPAGSWDNEAAIVIKDGKRCSDLAADYLVNYKEDDRIDIITPSLNAWQRKGKPIVFDGLAASCTYVIGADDIMSFKLNKLPKYLADMGYSWDLAEVLYDTSGKKVYEYHNNGSDYDDGTFGFKDDCKTPGTYTFYIIVSLKNPDGNYCGFKKYTVLIKAIEPCKTHDYYVSSTTATCTAGGTITETCTKCGETKTTNVGALGHTYEEYSAEYQWSYNNTNHWKYCYRCDKNIYQGKHTFNSNRICTVCGLDNNCDYGNAMDMEVNETHHWWACETHAPEDACPNDHKMEYGAHTVCPVDGMGNTSANTTYNCAYGYRCDGCGHYFGETGNHTWVMWRRIPATCYSEGRNIYKCTNSGKIDPSGSTVNCGYKYVTIPKTDHTWTLVSDTATCKADGKATYKCATTGCTETKVVDSPAKGHIYGLVSDTATCTAGGTATYKCNTCSASYTEASPKKAHNHVETSYVAPTTEAEGEITYKCTGCGNVKTEKLEKLTVINEPKTKSINYKDGVVIRPNLNVAEIPEGAVIEWTASNGCFNWSVDEEGNLTARSNASGETTFTAKIKLEDGTYMTDMYGNELVGETTVKSNAGFFQKIIGFFKGLFGLSKIHE